MVSAAVEERRQVCYIEIFKAYFLLSCLYSLFISVSNSRSVYLSHAETIVSRR